MAVLFARYIWDAVYANDIILPSASVTALKYVE